MAIVLMIFRFIEVDTGARRRMAATLQLDRPTSRGRGWDLEM